MDDNIKRLLQLCMEGDEKAEVDLFFLLRRRMSYHRGPKTSHKDRLGIDIYLGDYVLYLLWGGVIGGFGVVYKECNSRIGIFLGDFGTQSRRPSNYKGSRVNPNNCIVFSPQALEDKPWAKNLYEIYTSFFQKTSSKKEK